MMTGSGVNPQGYAVELYFDAEMEEKILTFRESIYKLGITPVLGKMGDKPHISLTVITQAEREHLKTLCESFSQSLKPFPVRLDAVGVFPTVSNVLYLLPIPSLQLIKVHQKFHQLLKKEKVVSKEYYLPDRWVPHCTIEFELSDSQFNQAVNLTKQLFTPIQGTFTSFGLISFKPIEYIAEYELQK